MRRTRTQTIVPAMSSKRPCHVPLRRRSQRSSRGRRTRMPGAPIGPEDGRTCLSKESIASPVAANVQLLCHQCGVSKPTAAFEGRLDYAGRSYCDKCWEDWWASSDFCVRCKNKCAGEAIKGSGVLTGLTMCAPCWRSLPSDHLLQSGVQAPRSCDQCHHAIGVRLGTRQFSGKTYCQKCWTEFLSEEEAMKSEAVGSDVTHAVSTDTFETHTRPTSVQMPECCERQCKNVGVREGTSTFSGKLYCSSCWERWYELTPEDISAAKQAEQLQTCRLLIEKQKCLTQGNGMPEWLQSLTPPRWALHYDFIEVGTSDWGTISHYCAGDFQYAAWMASQIRTSVDLYSARGLAVEPVREYLEALPQLPRVARIEAAMDETSGEDTLHCVSGNTTSELMGRLRAPLPGSMDHPDHPEGYEVDVMWYAKSLGSLGRPHPDLEPMLKGLGRMDLLQSRQVPVLSWGDLCTLYAVGSVDVVQLDCEGKDCAILRGLLTHCESHPDSYPRVIRFEANYLTDVDEVNATLSALQAHGYYLRSRDECNVIVYRW